MLARRRVRWLYLPPDAPDLAPIEPCWSKVKATLRKPKPAPEKRSTQPSRRP